MSNKIGLFTNFLVGLMAEQSMTELKKTEAN